MGWATVTCMICKRSQDAGEFGDWTCKQCGQTYMYEEGHMIVLTAEQLEALQVMKRVEMGDSKPGG